ncbi:MAG TPA: dihydrolipoamide acetyltransferase family protein [Planctomycetaceae bacterium]|jgi:pyruvate dehydrogenase E2 component (dihydrolipoamide acetyltransferase)|nr:dihydrolipoamide acetyltransferase family protein [Planctomycetaceae bacterium]
MAIEIKVPRLGWSMEEGTFVEWLKREGQTVQAGEPLFAIEGDKAIQEVEAIGSGILRLAPRAPEIGETVKVGATLAFLLAPEEAETFRAGDDQTVATTAERPAPSKENADFKTESLPSEPAVATSPVRSNGPRISPRAARVAAELGVDWKTLQGSGRTGRIRERDVLNAVARQGPGRRGRTAPAPREVPAGSAPPQTYRRTIAARMLEGSQQTAPVTLTTTADATNLASLRAQFKATAPSPGDRIPGYTDIMVKLVARALQEHPALNQQWIDDRIVTPDGVHIAIAVDTPAGLLAPVISDVPSLGLREIAARTHDLKERAHTSQLKPQELKGGTFTISNLGAFGIDAFTPIINLPQCAILGLGRIERRPMVVSDQIVPREAITLSLTFDHRIVDGAPAARFLAALRQAIENPGPWLVF